MDYYLDRVSVFCGVIVVEGWSDAGAPTIAYGDPDVVLTQTNLAYDHTTAGSDPRKPFRICGVTNRRTLRHEAITLVFANGHVVANPGQRGPALADDPYTKMVQRFYTETTRGGRLLEIGSRARSGHVHNHLFSPDVDYVGMDITDGPNVDIVGDAHDLTKCAGRGFDFMFSTAVFEHLLMPWKVAIEMGHALKPGGIAFVQSHAAFPLHDEPWDFWRYSKSAWRALFNAHTGFEILDTQYAVPCAIVPDHAPGGPIQDIEFNPTYILSACLVRKIAEPRVKWSQRAADVYDLSYSH